MSFLDKKIFYRETYYLRKRMKDKNPSLIRKIFYLIAKTIYFGKYPSVISKFFGLQGQTTLTKISVDFELKKRGLKPINCCFLSDFHFGNLTSERIFTAIEKMLSENHFDLILLGGDYIFLDSFAFEEMKEFIKKFSPPFGIFAVLGNHDRWILKEDLKKKFAQCGVTLLINDEVSLSPPYNQIKIFGIDDIKYGSPKLIFSTLKEGEKRIFLCHSPEGLSLLQNEKIDLGLFGHTHGGQIVFTPKKPFLPFKDEYSKKFAKGFYEKKESGFDFPFYVSSGIGCVWLPIRFNSPSEVVFIELI